MHRVLGDLCFVGAPQAEHRSVNRSIGSVSALNTCRRRPGAGRRPADLPSSASRPLGPRDAATHPPPPPPPLPCHPPPTRVHLTLGLYMPISMATFVRADLNWKPEAKRTIECEGMPPALESVRASSVRPSVSFCPLSLPRAEMARVTMHAAHASTRFTKHKIPLTNMDHSGPGRHLSYIYII